MSQQPIQEQRAKSAMVRRLTLAAVGTFWDALYAVFYGFFMMLEAWNFLARNIFSVRSEFGQTKAQNI